MRKSYKKEKRERRVVINAPRAHTWRAFQDTPTIVLSNAKVTENEVLQR